MIINLILINNDISKYIWKHKQAGVCTMNRSNNYWSHFQNNSPPDLDENICFQLVEVFEFSNKKYTPYDVTSTHPHIRYMMHQLAQEWKSSGCLNTARSLLCVQSHLQSFKVRTWCCLPCMPYSNACSWTWNSSLSKTKTRNSKKEIR